MNPQMSAPTKGAPMALKRSAVVMETRRSVHVAALSPVQCAVTLPEPENVDLRTQATLTRNPCPSLRGPQCGNVCFVYVHICPCRSMAHTPYH